MKRPVFFSDLRIDPGKTLLDKLDRLLERVDLRGKVREKDLVALKLHFGEQGNTAFVQPVFLRRVVDHVKGLNGKPFLTDTNTLYIGSRSESVSHLRTAYGNGFVYSVVDAPVLIADGLKGNSAVRVHVDRPIFKSVPIAHDIFTADVLVCVTHFKGHELTGFGGALKNLGMGCTSREGKLSEHSNISPKVKAKECKGCERCLRVCPGQAISMLWPKHEVEQKRRVAFIDPRKCIGCGECILACPPGVIQIRWNETIPVFQKKIVEHAYGAVQNKKGKAVYLNFLTQISPACDCCSYSDRPIVPDVGILSSEDPVAIDQASADLVNQSEGNPGSKLPGAWKSGEDKFRALYPRVDWTTQLAYAEEIGLGTREYELVKV
jgi:uncharacterized protein